MIRAIAIDIPRERVHECWSRACAVAPKLEGARNYDGESENGAYRYFCGYLGEEAFAVWLESRGLPYRHRKSEARCSLASDFSVSGYSIEVKASGSASRRKLIIGANRDRSASIFVRTGTRALRLAAGLWELCAWYSRAEVAAAPVIRSYKGSPCRELDDRQATREFFELAQLLESNRRADDEGSKAAQGARAIAGQGAPPGAEVTGVGSSAPAHG